MVHLNLKVEYTQVKASFTLFRFEGHDLLFIKKFQKIKTKINLSQISSFLCLDL